jgi:hypothetical protein
MSATMSSSILNMTDLMHRVDDDRELLAELFFISKRYFPLILSVSAMPSLGIKAIRWNPKATPSKECF